MEHLKIQGFVVQSIEVSDINTVKDKYGVPAELTSCHTAIIQNYIIEGHVPAEDIIELVSEKMALKGLSVPEMPVGTPGMENDDRKDAFDVISFDAKGTKKKFKSYSHY